ncbi:MAG: hypothetical protein WBQ14_08185 [Gaiellaceae bacterium]
MTINYRPGRGGHRRRLLDGEIDIREGLEAYGEANWISFPDGSSVGIIDLDPEGNALGAARLSSKDRKETLVDQLDAISVLVRRNPKIRLRKLILAEAMSGKWQVRPDRAGPPPAGLPERHDMLVLDKWLEEGWVEHLLWRDPTRVARELLPGHTLLDRWQNFGTHLWFAEIGREVDYQADRSTLGMNMIVSAEERARSSGRMQSGQIRKGPLVGKGWLGRNRFGFTRDGAGNPIQDMEQWPWIRRAFQLAEGDSAGPGLSTRKVTEALAVEGCTFDHDRVRTLLKDKIYATGEFTVKVHGIEIAQKPIPLVDPVPLDQFLRIQELMALRAGPSSTTPLGEFLFNYVHTFHKRCKDELIGKKKTRKVRLRGYIDQRNPKARRYKHHPNVPACCGLGGPGSPAVGWERDELERPIVKELRRLATHPEIVRELNDIVRHDVASNGNGLLSGQQVVEMEHQLEDLCNKRDVAIEAWVDSLPVGESPDMRAATRVMQAFDTRIAALEHRLERDKDGRRAQTAAGMASDGQRREERLNAFLDILTIETPEDLRHKALRARLFERLVHSIEIDEDDDGNVVATVEGFLVPPDTPWATRDLIDTSADLLDAHLLEKEGLPAPQNRVLRRRAELQAQVQTDLSAPADKSVWNLYPELLTLPGNEQIAALERLDFSSSRWRHAHQCKGRIGVPAWRTDVRCKAPRPSIYPTSVEVGTPRELHGAAIRHVAMWFLLNRHASQIHYRDLLAEMQAAGFVIPMKDPAASLFSILIQSAAIEHVPKSLFWVQADVEARLEAALRECLAQLGELKEQLAAPAPSSGGTAEAKAAAERKRLLVVVRETRWRERRLRRDLSEVRAVVSTANIAVRIEP